MSANECDLRVARFANLTGCPRFAAGAARLPASPDARRSRHRERVGHPPVDHIRSARRAEPCCLRLSTAVPLRIRRCPAGRCREERFRDRMQRRARALPHAPYTGSAMCPERFRIIARESAESTLSSTMRMRRCMAGLLRFLFPLLGRTEQWSAGPARTARPVQVRRSPRSHVRRAFR